MKASYKWLEEWADISSFKDPKELGDLLTARGLEVEEFQNLAEGFEKVISVQIISKLKHPEADRLSVCTVNPGDGEYIEIVCGASNMKVGDVVALAQIGANLPNGMKIEKGKIRGVVSNGMLCSETELGLADESAGILILPPKTPLGWKLSDILGIEDSIYEIKLTANRGDCLSHRGLAREIAAATGTELKTPKVTELNFSGTTIPQLGIKIELEAGEDAPQFFGCVIQGVVVGPSPDWLKRRLEAIGQRSINNIVDISNYLMFEYGYPVHIYDADKIEGGVIRVRKAQKGEKFPLLDQVESGEMVEMQGTELVIADGVKPIGLAGVMGGGNSEVSASTKRIFLECAEFNPTLVRRSAFHHQRRSEASLRFEKGIDPAGLKDAIQRLADLVIKVPGSKSAMPEVLGAACIQLPSRQTYEVPVIETTVDYINAHLGTDVSGDQMQSILTGLECQVESDASGKLSIRPPSYRLDLRIPQDLSEEVARSIGYDAIPTTIPALSGNPTPRKGNPLAHRHRVIEKIKDVMVDQGMSEILSYAFHSESWIKKFAHTPSVRVLNPISEDQAWMVPSLLPGIMKAYQENERHHFGSEAPTARLFEVRPVFSKTTEGPIAAKSEMETGVLEQWRLSFLMSGLRYQEALKRDQNEVDFYDLKSVAEGLFGSLRTKGVRMRPADASILGAASSPNQNWESLFHPGQCMQVAVGKDAVGFFGRMHPALEKELKVRTPIYWGEINVEPVVLLTPDQESKFQAWSSFPTMERDFALLVDESVLGDSLVQTALKVGKPIAKVVKIFDTYKGAPVPEGKVSVGVRVIFSDEAKSLVEKQVDECSERIVGKWHEECGAVLR